MYGIFTREFDILLSLMAWRRMSPHFENAGGDESYHQQSREEEFDSRDGPAIEPDQDVFGGEKEEHENDDSGADAADAYSHSDVMDFGVGRNQLFGIDFHRHRERTGWTPHHSRTYHSRTHHQKIPFLNTPYPNTRNPDPHSGEEFLCALDALEEPIDFGFRVVDVEGGSCRRRNPEDVV